MWFMSRIGSKNTEGSDWPLQYSRWVWVIEIFDTMSETNKTFNDPLGILLSATSRPRLEDTFQGAQDIDLNILWLFIFGISWGRAVYGAQEIALKNSIFLIL